MPTTLRRPLEQSFAAVFGDPATRETHATLLAAALAGLIAALALPA